MPFFIILSPFIVLAVLLAFTSASASLLAGAGVALALIGVDLWRGQAVKMLTAGSVALFTTLACYLGLIEHEWSDFSVRLTVDLGILAIALASIGIGLPFTTQYAREQVGPDTVRTTQFLRVNYVLSWAWVGAMVVIMLADISMIWFPNVPLWVGIAAIFAARSAAVQFTRWYAHRWIAKAALRRDTRPTSC